MVEAIDSEPVRFEKGNKVPLPGLLPAPKQRVFDNSDQEKPQRKKATLVVKFGELTPKNFEQMRILNYLTLPVVYSENFYDYLKQMQRYSKFAYVKDILVGAISCKEDILEDGSHACYIMTITVLKPYRRYGIASQLLEQAIKDCMQARNVSLMTLHVQASNEAAYKFYMKHGFELVEKKIGYYTELDDADCYVLNKKIDLSSLPPL